jgi:hypothetical protein
VGAQTQFASSNGEVVIVADDFAIEVFTRSFQESSRLPTAWVGVSYEQRKHEQIRVKFGWAKDPAGPMYGENADLLQGTRFFELPNTEEPALRAFFAEAAGRAGRVA